MTWLPHITVATIVEDNGRFLMVEELKGGRAVLNQPAGHLDPHETLTEAAVRETLEETGWRFEPTALLGIFHMNRADPDRVYLRFTFTGTLLEHLPDYSIDPDITAVHWLTREQIRQQQPRVWRSELVGLSLDCYESGVRYPLESLQYFMAQS